MDLDVILPRTTNGVLCYVAIPFRARAHVSHLCLALTIFLPLTVVPPFFIG